MINLFFMGGVLFMSFLTLELIGLFLAMWKAPSWVKEIGLLALITGIIGQLMGLYNAFMAIEAAGGVSIPLLASGLKVSSITTIYGCLIYLISLAIRLYQKPKFW